MIIWVAGEMIDGCEAWLNMLKLWDFRWWCRSVMKHRLHVCDYAECHSRYISMQICCEHYNKIEQHICIVSTKKFFVPPNVAKHFHGLIKYPIDH